MRALTGKNNPLSWRASRSRWRCAKQRDLREQRGAKTDTATRTRCDQIHCTYECCRMHKRVERETIEYILQNRESSTRLLFKLFLAETTHIVAHPSHVPQCSADRHD